ncbi:MAG TPA: DinB family protein [Jiangellaceae bacterium]
MTWIAPEVSLPEGPLTGDDRPILEGFLAWHRARLRHKCAGLMGEQLAQCSVPPSNLSLLGLVRHMAKVERRWFRELIAGQEFEPMYDQALGKDADFDDVRPDRAQADYERLLQECRLAEEALAAASFDDTVTARAGVMSVRAVVVHMIEEYAQHNGHADLLRECIDGTTDK